MNADVRASMGETMVEICGCSKFDGLSAKTVGNFKFVQIWEKNFRRKVVKRVKVLELFV
jgi:hypothetical protein